VLLPLPLPLLLPWSGTESSLEARPKLWEGKRQQAPKPDKPSARKSRGGP
jgi:hypothetical protein